MLHKALSSCVTSNANFSFLFRRIIRKFEILCVDDNWIDWKRDVGADGGRKRSRWKGKSSKAPFNDVAHFGDVEKLLIARKTAEKNSSFKHQIDLDCGGVIVMVK